MKNLDEEQENQVRAIKKAAGYEYEEKIVEAKKDGTQGKVKILKKHMPPDPKAAEVIYRLKQCGQW